MFHTGTSGAIYLTYLHRYSQSKGTFRETLPLTAQLTCHEKIRRNTSTIYLQLCGGA